MHNIHLKKQGSSFLSTLLVSLFISGCAAPSYLQGVSPQGGRVYSGSLPIEKTRAYTDYYYSTRSEAAKINYLFERFQNADGLVFIKDGTEYNWLEVYRAGKWLVRNRYEDNQSARDFLKKEVWLSKETGRPNLVRLSTGDLHIGYFILLNELDLLDETIAEDRKPLTS